MIKEEEKQGNRNNLKYKWLIKEQKEITKEFLDIACGSEIIAKLLLNRGINTVEKAKAYLNPEFYKESRPEEIPELVKAKDRIIEAINKNQKITIFGDYDVDGVTSTSCLLIALRQFTKNIDFYIPSRLTEGYGLNIEAVKTIASKNKTKLLITCDCGITNHKEVKLAQELGIDVIVTDHHSLPEILPPAHAVLNPKLLPADHKLHWLPGVGVAYKLAEAILEQKQGKQIVKDDLLDLVALGMIADLAPLVDENRYLVQIGLKKLATTKKVGLQELLRMCGCLKEESGDKPNAEHIGFGIAPRINAVGRLTDAAQAVRLLTTENLFEAVQMACELEAQNKERQLICEETLKEALEIIKEQELGRDKSRPYKNDKCIVLAKENWHHGVIGIVASRIVEKFHLPTILIAIDNEQNIARGSGRSISQLNIVEALVNSSTYLEKYGGHKAACGLSVKPENINNFIVAFKQYVTGKLIGENIEAIVNIDSELALNDLNLDLIEKIYRLSPFGLGNTLPVFASNEVEIAGTRNIGKNGQHLKLQLSAKSTKIFEALIWNHDPNIKFTIGEKINIVYTPKLNHFNGETSIQLEIKDWQVRERDGATESEGVGEENIVEIYDFRGKIQECLALFSKELNTVFFAETEQKNYLPLKTTSRNNISKIKNLVFLECPPDENTLIETIKLSNPEIIYLSFSRGQTHGSAPTWSAPTHLLKNLTGLLKYTVSNKNSTVNENDLMSALGINKSALAFALETLVKIGFLSYKRDTNALNINLSESYRQNYNDLIEYNLLTSELKQITKFRNWLYETDLTEIIKLLSVNDIKTVIANTERMRLTL